MKEKRLVNVLVGFHRCILFLGWHLEWLIVLEHGLLRKMGVRENSKQKPPYLVKQWLFSSTVHQSLPTHRDPISRALNLETVEQTAKISQQIRLRGPEFRNTLCTFVAAMWGQYFDRFQCFETGSEYLKPWWHIPLNKWVVTLCISGWAQLIHTYPNNWGYNPLTKWD